MEHVLGRESPPNFYLEHLHSYFYNFNLHHHLEVRSLLTEPGGGEAVISDLSSLIELEYYFQLSILT